MCHCSIACSRTCRSNSAHDLGEAIDPEQLPDIESLQESFEIPAQLRLDLPHSAHPHNNDPPSQAPYAHQSRSPHQRQHQLPCTDQYDRSLMRGRTDQYAAVAQPVSAATTPSRPCSTASEDSVPPGCHYTHTKVPQQPHGALPHEGQHSSPGDPARLPQSKSLPLLDDFDGLTELQQQAADMMAHVGLPLLCNHTACVVQCMQVYSLQCTRSMLHVTSTLWCMSRLFRV